MYLCVFFSFFFCKFIHGERRIQVVVMKMIEVWSHNKDKEYLFHVVKLLMFELAQIRVHGEQLSIIFIIMDTNKNLLDPLQRKCRAML